MAVDALLAAEMHFLCHCRAHIRAVAATCRALAEGIDREWSTGRLARAARAIERDDLAVLRLAALDDTEWRFAMMRARRRGRRVPAYLMSVSRRLAHILPPYWRQPNPADLVAWALMLTPESVAAATTGVERFADPAIQHCLLNHRFWPQLACHIGRATADRASVRSVDRRIPFKHPADLVGNVASDSPDYSVALHVNGVAVAVAPLMVMQFSEAALVFDAPAAYAGQFCAHYTTYMLPEKTRELYQHGGVLLDDEMLYIDGLAYPWVELASPRSL